MITRLQVEPGTSMPCQSESVPNSDVSGSSIVARDGTAPRSHAYAHIPGLVEALVWATDNTDSTVPPAVPSTGPPPMADPSVTASSYVPPPGGTRLIWLQIPPDAVFATPSFDADAARAEQLVASPGLAERFEPDSPGMHATPTVDYAIVVEGPLWLELDGGVETMLEPGDVVVQNGTRHAWRNHGDRRALLVVVLVGTAASPTA